MVAKDWIGEERERERREMRGKFFSFRKMKKADTGKSMNRQTKRRGKTDTGGKRSEGKPIFSFWKRKKIVEVGTNKFWRKGK